MNKSRKAIKLFLFLGIVLTSFSVNAQSYHKMLADSNRWNVGRDWGNWSTIIYKSWGDTMIDSFHYKFINKRQDVFSLGNLKFIREDTVKKQILCRVDKNSKDIVIYDFSLKVGDTINVPFSQGGFVRFKVESRTSLGSGDTFNLIVDSASTNIYPINFTWIEGIGCTSSFVYPFEGYNVDGYTSDLLCSYRNGIRTYSNPNGHPCMFFLGVEQSEKNEGQINIYPNPSNGKYSISFSEIFSGDVLIYDMIGNLKYSGKASNSIKLDLDLPVPSGIYLLKLNNGRDIYTQKLIKN